MERGRTNRFSIEHFSNLVAQIHHGPLEREPWRSFLRLLVATLDCDAAFVSIGHRRWAAFKRGRTAMAKKQFASNFCYQFVAQREIHLRNIEISVASDSRACSSEDERLCESLLPYFEPALMGSDFPTIFSNHKGL